MRNPVSRLARLAERKLLLDGVLRADAQSHHSRLLKPAYGGCALLAIAKLTPHAITSCCKDSSCKGSDDLSCE
jgi:hypothetical protein